MTKRKKKLTKAKVFNFKKILAYVIKMYNISLQIKCKGYLMFVEMHENSVELNYGLKLISSFYKSHDNTTLK
jgi:ubiquitin C-terminal hydrolase